MVEHEIEIARSVSKEPVQPSRKYDMVILDFHGVLTDNQLRLIASLYHAVTSVLGTKKKPYKEFCQDKEIFQDAITREPRHLGGVDNKTFLQQKFSGKIDPVTLEELLRTFKDYMDELYFPIPGMVGTIKFLQEVGVKMPILTDGKDHDVIRLLLKKWGLASLANRVYSKSMTGLEKPDPQTVEMILRDYEIEGVVVPREKILLVGDYRDDIKTAAAAGLDSVLIVRASRFARISLGDPNPTYVISFPSELIPIVAGIRPPDTNVEDVYPILWPRELGPSGKK